MLAFVLGSHSHVPKTKCQHVHSLSVPPVCFPAPQVEGSAHAGGDFGYVPQNPWCQNLSLRENIVFGQPWDEAHYREVLHACALELDLEILAAGDLSKVGGCGSVS